MTLIKPDTRCPLCEAAFHGCRRLKLRGCYSRKGFATTWFGGNVNPPKPTQKIELSSSLWIVSAFVYAKGKKM